jgi:RNA polymerase sigma-70 factor (sigma-E family)
MEIEEKAMRVEGRTLDQLYRLHIDQAFRIAYLLTGNRTVAEDLAQEAFMRIAGRLLHLRRPSDFGAYLRKTVVSVAMSHFRRRRVEERYLRRESGLRSDQDAQPDLGARDQMRLALLRLPRRQRTAVVLRFYEDLSDNQAAEVMGCRPATVRSLVARGLRTLRPLVEGDGHD